MDIFPEVTRGCQNKRAHPLFLSGLFNCPPLSNKKITAAISSPCLLRRGNKAFPHHYIPYLKHIQAPCSIEQSGTSVCSICFNIKYRSPSDQQGYIPRWSDERSRSQPSQRFSSCGPCASRRSPWTVSRAEHTNALPGDINPSGLGRIGGEQLSS